MFRKDRSGQPDAKHRHVHRHSCNLAQAGTKDVIHHPNKRRLPSALLTTSVFSQQ